VLVPVGGVLIAHFVIRRPVTDIAALYDLRGARSGVRWAGVAAWAAGIAVYYAVPAGSTMPSLVASIAAYLLLAPRRR
jgi:cytosine/uracil/thiamine/allantoin permease